MPHENQPLPKITPEPELVGLREGNVTHIVSATHVGELTVADVLGEHSASLSTPTEVDGGGVFKVGEDGRFVSHDGSRVYDPQTRKWLHHDYEPAAIEATPRVKALFSPFAPDAASSNGSYNRFHRGVVTPESAAAALTMLAEERKVDSQIDKLVGYYAGYDTTDETLAALRTNSELRLAVGDHLLKKTDKVATTLPRQNRIHANDTKATKVAGYPHDMTSREYTAALALAMLDGTFRGEDADEINYDLETDLGDDGQHRMAARMVLESEV